ncbi:IclR family transcriptional regulator domain-containing protein [Sulfurospirillum sp. 1612]|uniref:IclR family transcriptional regulator domain-containing protein n=1 Tax=Sulfurospirillum sp. 1612 TaxID=3094835 RepID=UPI002F94D584
MQKQTENKEIVGTLIKGLNVIKAFDSQHQSMTLSEVAKTLDITRASARRLLLTLESLGYVQQRHNQFSLTPKIIELGFSYFASRPWTDLAYENMKTVSQQCKISCSTSVLDGDYIICIARVPATQIIHEEIHVGSRLPTAYSSTGRVFMTHMPDEELRAFIDTLPLKAFTKNSIVDPNLLFEKMKAERAQSYQMVVEELEEGMLSMAVPIYGRNQELKGAMNVGTHTGLNSPETLIKNVLPILQRAAMETTKAIKALRY